MKKDIRRNQLRNDLLRKLESAQLQRIQGKKGKSLQLVMKNLRTRFNKFI